MANEQFVSRYRKYGEEQPYWKAGIFKIRLPFIHYAWSIPEMVQALFMCATCLGAIPVLTEVRNVSPSWQALQIRIVPADIDHNIDHHLHWRKLPDRNRLRILRLRGRNTDHRTVLDVRIGVLMQYVYL